MAKLFEKFGEFDSAEELNRTAEGLKAEGDIESLRILAEENGLDREDVEDFLDGGLDMLTTPMLAADGKLKMEEKAAELPEDILIQDWANYIREELSENPKMKYAVRRKGKSLIGCIGVIMAEAFKNQWNVPEAIKKAAGVKAGKITFGVPSMGRTKEIIRTYYLGEAGHEEKGA